MDAKSYIQSVLKNSGSEGHSREEQIQQKEQILAELQRVERELQEKAHAQMQLSREAGEGSSNPLPPVAINDSSRFTINCLREYSFIPSCLAFPTRFQHW